MSIKETINNKGLDVNIKFTLDSGIKFIGQQQGIDKFVETTKESLINPVVDEEIRRIGYKTIMGPATLKFYFRHPANGTLFNTFGLTGAGFTSTEISENNVNIRNSFFILDFYDSYNPNTQTKIFTQYLTQILSGENNLPTYRIYNDTVNQLYNWCIPQSYLDTFTSYYNTGYVKFSFYDAKTGKILLFYNKTNEGLSTPLKMYFPVQIYKNTFDWKFETVTPIAYEYPSNNAYVQQVNDRISNFENLQQIYPDGNTFDYKTGNYDTE